MIRAHRRLPGILTVTLVAVALFIPILQAAPAHAIAQKLSDAGGVNNNPHNLSSTGTSSVRAGAGESDQICIFCHTPHNASPDGPLWNRPDITTALGGGNFPLYGHLDEILIDTIAEAKYGGVNQYPNGATRLCLSCHDGVTAMGTVISSWGGDVAPSLGAMTTMVVDLSTSHPISFTYGPPGDPGFAVETALDAKPGVTAGQYKQPSAGILDDQGRMQCTACHDPHLDTNDGTYTLPMWRHYTGVENADYEATCAECHIGGSTSSGLIRTLTPPDLHAIP